MKINIEKIGNSNPKIAIIGCVHGDEIIGKKVINELKKINLKNGSLYFIIANQEALNRKKRYIKKDLNRSFPGKINGIVEEKIAYKIKKELKRFDVVIDIHATNSNFDSLVVVTKFNTEIKKILKFTPIDKIALIRKKVFGGNDLISYAKLGVSLEYGPDKSGKNYKKCLKDIKIVLKNLGLISGKKIVFKQKTLYTVKGKYKVSNQFKQNNCLKDFKLIKKGDIMGKDNLKEVISTKNFYPIFLGKGKYKNILSLMADEKKIEL